MEESFQIALVVCSFIVVALLIILNYHVIASTEELQSNSIEVIKYCKSFNTFHITEIGLTILLSLISIFLPYKVEFIVLIPKIIYFVHLTYSKTIQMKPINAFTYADDNITIGYIKLLQNLILVVCLMCRLVFIYADNFKLIPFK
ncbi:Cornichon protein [Entamoeba marina]